MNKQLPATISFRLEKHKMKDCNGNPLKPLLWDNILAEIDFYDSKINCKVELDFMESMALLFSGDNLEITALTIKYNGLDYKVNVTKCEVYLSSKSSATFDCTGSVLERQKIAFSFSLRESVLYLIPDAEDRKNYLVFSGAHAEPFEIDLQYKGQSFHFSSPKDSDLLTVYSDREFLKNDWLLIILAFSLFQNAEIKLLESHTEKEFLLYIQLPPPAGTRLCTDKSIFPLIWQWLIKDDFFLLQRNMLEFFFAGARNRGGYIDFRLINLLVCMNSICGKDGKFGENISNTFGVSEGDGHWLAYVRNHMVHAGKSISEAIAEAFADFAIKQAPRGLSLSRYAAYNTAIDKEKLPFALYCDIIDLIMAYFMKIIGYPQRINEIRAIYGIMIK